MRSSRFEFLRRLFRPLLWLGLPVAAGVAAGAVWLLLHGDPTLTPAQVRSEMLGAVIVTAAAWLLGLWVAEKEGPGRDRWAEKAAREGRSAPSLRQKLILGAVTACWLLLVAGLSVWEFAETVAETGNLRLGLADASVYLFLFAASAVPAFLIRRTKNDR